VERHWETTPICATSLGQQGTELVARPWLWRRPEIFVDPTPGADRLDRHLGIESEIKPAVVSPSSTARIRTCRYGEQVHGQLARTFRKMNTVGQLAAGVTNRGRL
jgi:hypothetical protein